MINAWLKKNNFNERGTTFIYYPKDSYDVRDSLKAAGFRFSNELLWHAAECPSGYEDMVAEVAFDDLGKISAWGEGFFNPDVKAVVKNKLDNARPAYDLHTETFGAIGDHFENIAATYISTRIVNTKYGQTNLIKFITDDNRILNWWTKKSVSPTSGCRVRLSFDVKSFEEFDDEAMTTIRRVKVVDL